MEKSVILHVMHDEKFNDMAIEQFESTNVCTNEYWVTCEKLTLTKSLLAKPCRTRDLYSQIKRKDIAGVVFHSLPPSRYPLLIHVPKDKCVVWLGWGYDYYFLNSRINKLTILPRTRQINTAPLRKRIKSKILHELRIARHPSIKKPESLRRVDYFAPVLDIEFDMIKNCMGLPAKYVEWNYGTAEDDLTPPLADSQNMHNILAGNSASATNNHIELFEAIYNQVDWTGRKIITPLSYGDSDYRDKVIHQGQKYFGDSFVPLVKFMPLTEYQKTIASCGFIAMNHLRQQAMGNICTGMLMGATIYLNDSNPLKSWLHSRGGKVGSIAHMDMQPLSVSEKKRNRDLIYAHWGREIQREKTRNLLNLILLNESRH